MLHNPMKIHSKGEKQTLVRPKKINNKNKEKEKEKGKRGKGEKENTMVNFREQNEQVPNRKSS